MEGIQIKRQKVEYIDDNNCNEGRSSGDEGMLLSGQE